MKMPILGGVALEGYFIGGMHHFCRGYVPLKKIPSVLPKSIFKVIHYMMCTLGCSPWQPKNQQSVCYAKVSLFKPTERGILLRPWKAPRERGSEVLRIIPQSGFLAIQSPTMFQVFTRKRRIFLTVDRRSRGSKFPVSINSMPSANNQIYIFMTVTL